MKCDWRLFLKVTLDWQRQTLFEVCPSCKSELIIASAESFSLQEIKPEESDSTSSADYMFLFHTGCSWGSSEMEYFESSPQQYEYWKIWRVYHLGSDNWSIDYFLCSPWTGGPFGQILVLEETSMHSVFSQTFKAVSVKVCRHNIITVL